MTRRLLVLFVLLLLMFLGFYFGVLHVREAGGNTAGATERGHTDGTMFV